MTCFLAQFAPDTPCDGRLIRAHLIPRQQIKWAVKLNGSFLTAKDEQRATRDWINDPRCWVPACGGIVGNSGHHGMLDASRTLRIPREALPAGLEQFAEELGLTYWLEREYGPLEAAA